MYRQLCRYVFECGGGGGCENRRKVGLFFWVQVSMVGVRVIRKYRVCRVPDLRLDVAGRVSILVGRSQRRPPIGDAWCSFWTLVSRSRVGKCVLL
jgi:hypothetical protein